VTLDYSQVFISTRINEHSGVFREDGGIMFCNFCDLSVEWKSKSTIVFQKDIVRENKNMKLMNKKKNKPFFLSLILYLNQKKKS